MSERSSYVPGTPNWVDLGTTDVDGAVSFYGALFGWSATEPGPVDETGGYRMFTQAEKNIGGLMATQSPEQPVAWLTYIATEDADATTEKVVAAGGTVMVPPMDVMEIGRMAVYIDPTGAAIAVWQSKQFPGAGLVNEPVSLCWNELATRDAETSLAFYTAVFGWQSETRDVGPTTYTTFSVDGKPVGGMIEMTDQWPAEAPPHWMVYFAVDDVDASTARAAELGATVHVPAMDIPDVGRFSMVADPSGAHFSMLTLANGEM